MKTNKLLFTLALAAFFVTEASSQTSPEYNRQLGGDLENFIFNRNSISVLYRKMETPGRALRLRANISGGVSYTGAVIPDSLETVVRSELIENKATYNVAVGFSIGREKWVSLGDKFSVYFGPEVGINVSSGIHYDNPFFKWSTDYNDIEVC